MRGYRYVKARDAIGPGSGRRRADCVPDPAERIGLAQPLRPGGRRAIHRVRSQAVPLHRRHGRDSRPRFPAEPAQPHTHRVRALGEAAVRGNGCRSMGHDPVQRTAASMRSRPASTCSSGADHNATTGVLVTTSWFGRASEQFANRNRITLINGAELKQLLKKYLDKDVIPGTSPPKRLRASANVQTARPGPDQP